MQTDIEIIFADWDVPEVVAGCTTRQGGVSENEYASLNLGAHTGDVPEYVTQNRHRLVSAASMPDEPAWLRQVHGTKVVRDPRGDVAADAAITGRSGVVCAVMIADCLPVLLTSDDGAEVAAVHAGWRGLSAGVIENALAEMRTENDRILAWLGPAISPANFEVGEEVRDAFCAADAGAGGCFTANANGRLQADLYGLARRRLSAAGVERVSGGGLCTFADETRFFSYRRDGQCGRMTAFVFRSS